LWGLPFFFFFFFFFSGTAVTVLVGPGEEQPQYWNVQQTGAHTASLHPLVNQIYATVYGLAFIPDADIV
jgi:hypothetical protein